MVKLLIMPALSYLTRSFQNVYLRRSTGVYYTRARWPVSPKKADHELVSGKPSFLLAPVFRLFRVDVDNVENYQEIFNVPRSGRTNISVGLQELELHFDLLPEFRAVQNSDLNALLVEYEREHLSSEPGSLAKIAHRYAMTMEDGQARCLLELMARVLDTQFPVQTATIPLVGNGEDVVK